MADAKYVVEYARSANSVCKHTTCGNKDINDGELRIGKLVKTQRAGTTAYNTTEKMLPNWYHPKCMFEMLKKAQKSTKMLFSGEDFHFGWDSTSPEDQQSLQTMMDQLKIDRETPKTKKRPLTEVKVPAAKKQKTNHDNSHTIVLVEDNWTQILSYVPSEILLTKVLYVSKIFHKLAVQQICQKGLDLTTISTEPPKWLTDLSSILIVNYRQKQSLLSSLTNLTSFTAANSSCNVAMRQHLMQCTRLRELHISSCTIARGAPDIATVAANISSLTKLAIIASQSLALGDTVPLNQWASMYGELTQLKHLEFAYMDEFMIKYPTDNWTNLTNLETLKLWDQTRLDQHWLDIFAQMTALRNLELDLAYVVDANRKTVTDFDMAPMTNITKLTLKGSRSALPKTWPANLKEVTFDFSFFNLRNMPDNTFFEKVKFSNMNIGILQALKSTGAMLPKGTDPLLSTIDVLINTMIGSVKELAIDVPHERSTTMDEILAVDPECLQIFITETNDAAVSSLKTLFGDMSRMPKQIRVFLPDDFDKRTTSAVKKRAKEDIEQLLAQMQDNTQLLL